ncbi:MAG: PAS domain S-box protein, partial [Candidatus Thorarchaeota archaeon]
MTDPVDSRLCQTILENAPTLIINADKSGNIIFSNRDEFNFTQDELKGRSIYDFIDARYVQGLRKTVSDTISTKVPQVYEFEDELETGTRNWFRLRISPIVIDGIVDSIILISNSITEQIQFEEKLRDSEAKLRSIFNATLEGIILSDEDGNIAEWNKAQEDMFGLSRSEVLGKKLYDVQFNMIPEERRTPHRYESLKRSIETFLESGDAPWIHEVTEVEIEFKDGKDGIIQQYATPIKTSKGHSLCAFIHDVTDRRTAEEEQAKSEKRYRSLFDQNNDGVVILDLSGKHVDFNKRAVEILGYTREELIGTATDFTVIPEEQQESRDQFRKVLDGAELPIYERNLKRKDGTAVPVEINISLVRNNNGIPVYVQSILRDISKRKNVEQELKKSEQKWKQLAEQSIQGITIHQDTKIVYANPAYSRMVGRSIEELYEMDVEQIWSIVHPEDREKRKARFRDYHRTGMTAESEVYRIIRPDGEVRWIDSGVSVIDFGGRPAMQRTAVDVTDRMLAEHALIEQRDRAEMYLQLAGVIFLVLDQEGIVTLINRKGTEVLGYEADEIIGSSWFDTVLDADRNNVQENFQKIIEGEVEQIEYVEREHLTNSGEKKLIAWHASVLRDSFGNITGVISSGEDITEKRAAQLELRASQEMLQLVMNNIPHHVFWKDLSSVYMGCNDTFAEVFVQGVPEDVIGKSDYDLEVDPEDAEKFRRADKFALESPYRRYDEIEKTTLPNGEEAWFRVVKVPLHDGLGNDIGILGTLEDVTEKRNAELELIESETKLRTLVNSMNDLVFVFDENNKYRQFYAQDIEDLYVPPSEFLGRTVSEVLPEDVSLPFSESLNQVRQSGSPVTFDYMLPDEEGERWFSASISLHEDGKSLVSVIRDI